MRTMMTMNDVGYDRVADGAYERMTQAWDWLCGQRDNAPDGADSWDIRWQVMSAGPEWLTDLTHQVLRGEYRLPPLQLQGQHENRKAVWGARDALVLKWVALSLQHLLPLHPACEHVKGHGGGKASVMKLHGLLTQDACDHGGEKKTATAATIDDAVQAAVSRRQYKWVCRTDIRGYYRNIDKQTLLSQVRQHVSSPVLRDLVDQYIHYTVEEGGTFHTPEKGISRGCPLSPLMGALHLYDMDEHFAKQLHIHYARYMDDIIILAKSRWQLRRHTKRLMQWFSAYGFEAHPDKTFIGRTEKGFDWMGAWLTHEGVRDIAPRAKANHREKVRRLYERLARVPLWRRKRARQEVHARVSRYRKRWTIWAAGLLAVSAVGTCQADGPVVVLASGNHAGDTGARFDLHGVVNGVIMGGDYGGVCLSSSASACNADGRWSAVHTPLGWGAKAVSVGPDNLVLVPRGSIIVACSTCGPATVATMDLATGASVTRGGVRYQACAPIAGDTRYRAFYYTSGESSQCPFSSNTYPWPPTGGHASVSVTGETMVYAQGPLKPWTGSLPPLRVGLHSGKDLSDEVPKPNAIIISGLNCNLTATAGAGSGGAGAGAVAELGDVPSRTLSGSSAAQGVVSATVTCGGSNGDAAVTVGLEVRPNAGTTVDEGYRLVSGAQPGYYGTFNEGGAGTCASGLPLGAGWSTGIHTYAAKEAGNSMPYTKNLTFSLCGTGQTQAPGTYSMAFTLQLVNR